MVNNTKTILIYIWNMDIGGVQKRVKDIAKYFNQNLPQYRLIILIKKAYPTPLLKQIKRLSNIEIYYFTQKNNFIFPGLTFLWFLYQLMKFKPNTVLTFLCRSSIQAALAKKIIFWQKFKLVLNEGIYTSDYLKIHENQLPFQSKLLKRLINIFYPLADMIIVPTKTIKKDLINNFSMSKNKIVVIPHWLTEKHKINPEMKDCDFIFIGRLEKEKNIWWLFDLAKNFQQHKRLIKICIVGKGSLEKELLQKIKEFRLDRFFYFKGFQENVNLFLNKSKILLLPSQNEGMPNCILEANNLGLPTVVFNFPGAAEIISNNRTGLIAKSKQEFIDDAQMLIKNNHLRIKMGLMAKTTIKNAFGKNNLQKFLNILIN